MSNPLKKTMVYLGLADEEEVVDEPQQQHSRVHAVEPKGTVTPLRPKAVHQPAAGGLTEILTVHPKQYKDAQIIAENFREGIPVIINLSQMSDADARRLIDFASGLSLGLYGRIERVTSKVFLLSPSHVAVLGDTVAQPVEGESTFFARQ